MTPQKVLFIDTAHPVLTEELTRMGYQCDYFENYSRNDYLRIVGQYFGIIIRGKIKLDAEMLTAARQLKFIGRVGAGMENIDVAYAESMGVACLNAPEGNRDAVGEHAVGMLLMLMNRLRIADREVRQGVWLREENRGTEIKGKTVAIIGYGNMGGAFARVLKGFGANVIAYDKYKSNYSDDFVSESDMQTIFDEADIVSLHLPLTPETLFLVDANYLKKFRKNIYLINTARGRNVKTADLVKQMKAGKVLGAALDVLEYEKLSFEALDQQSLPEDFTWLIRSDQVVLSPHIAGWTHESNYKLAKTIVDKVRQLFGEKAN
ncbi:MAG: NAD(P)-dependent oxidoreductase [Bacteroidales bacterium]|jgi:D-3-phosphoglycerate dehydrogenase|nr:NAD(P)-dependent oxidoreductase [Bacteroidales bacterium]MDD4175979.1 NAD(P)-dependent oxidoreductase [Bacteroidales bacterium]MDD4741559.1 NAD(P)-dependent oxidoreductase [Bacteroidales bacterium]MDY0335377.1 NAD(P)-dependent oxidoreductase [Bacteroidales bacterium]NCU37263.1 hydroxyacid dehydrogenase [Candidatus Falkowbacteria bacterium]